LQPDVWFPSRHHRLVESDQPLTSESGLHLFRNGTTQVDGSTRLSRRWPALGELGLALDAAVAAYGWADYSAAMADDEILHRWLKLKLGALDRAQILRARSRALR
jgi:hypothetical protein